MEFWYVESLANRNLSRLASYKALDQYDRTLPDSNEEITLAEDEMVIGLYLNSPTNLEDAILITNEGLYLRTGLTWQSIPYASLVSVNGPETKEEVSGVTLQLSGGPPIQVPVRGAHKQYRDAFLFLSFLMGILSKNQDAQNPAQGKNKSR